MGFVGLFFCIDKKLFLHSSPFQKATKYGNCLTYSKGHDETWERSYRSRYYVDYDYYPRGRLVYDIGKKHYKLYYDHCAEQEAIRLSAELKDAPVVLERDEHYQCHMCNPDYYEF